jgi:hypothetical protein
MKKQNQITSSPAVQQAVKIFILNFFLILSIMPSYAQELSVQLTPSVYNGYNISCFGSRDGAIDLTITGGTPPYSIMWSTRDTIEDLNGLASGYYRVEVRDATPEGTPVSAEITLTEPEALRIELQASSYWVNGRNYNISLNGACNAWITANPSGGVPPYSYHWEQLNGSTLQTVTNLCPMEYVVQVTDANGCVMENVKIIKEPERDDWTMNGNSGSNPATNFIGTKDAQDLVFKTNSTERLRIKDSGGISISSLSGNGNGIVTTDANGVLNRINLSFGQPGNCPDPQIFAWHHRQQAPQSVYTCWERVGINTSYPRENLQIGEKFTFHSGGSKFISFNSFYDPTPGIEKRRRILSGPVSTLNFHSNGSVEIQNLASSGTAGEYLEGNSALISRLLITEYGNVGVGTTNPENKFQVGDGHLRVGLGPTPGANGDLDWATSYLGFNAHRDPTNNLWTFNSDLSHNGGTVIWSTINGELNFSIKANTQTTTGNFPQTNITDQNIKDNARLKISDNNGGTIVRIQNVGNKESIIWTVNGQFAYGFGTETTVNGSIGSIYKDVNSPSPILSFDGNANVGIGALPDANNEFKLLVCGKIKATEVEVRTSWCDFVFNEDYKRMSFEEQEKYYKTHKKLPYLASGELIETDGLKIGHTMQGFVRNLEEARLDVIDLYKLIKELQIENMKLQEEINNLKKEK